MQYGQNLDVASPNPVTHNKRRPSNDKFPRSGDAPFPASHGMFRQQFCALPDFVRGSRGRRAIICRNVLEDADQLFPGGSSPADPHDRSATSLDAS